MNLQPATIDKLGKLFPRLASNHDGEVVATARAIIRTLESAGSSLHDLGGLMQPRTVERIVYREKPAAKQATAKKAKAKPKKAEAPPEPNYPPRESYPPRPDPTPRDSSTPFEEVLQWSDYMLENCELNDREIDFIKQVRKWAKAYRENFTLTEKQAAWWRRLVTENGINPETGEVE